MLLLIINNPVNSCKHVVYTQQASFQVAGSSFESAMWCSAITTHVTIKIPTFTTSIGFEAIVDNSPAIKPALDGNQRYNIITMHVSYQDIIYQKCVPI